MITSRSWVVVHNSSKIGSPSFAGGIGEVWVFLLTHNQSVKQICSSRLQITNMEGSETFMAQNAWFHVQMCLFGGIVDNKSCSGVQIPPKPKGVPFNAKPIIERALRKSHVNGATMLKLYSYIGIGRYLGICQNFSFRGRLGVQGPLM